MRGVRANAEGLDPTGCDEVAPESLNEASPSQALRSPDQEADRPVYNDWDEV